MGTLKFQNNDPILSEMGTLLGKYLGERGTKNPRKLFCKLTTTITEKKATETTKTEGTETMVTETTLTETMHVQSVSMLLSKVNHLVTRL